MIVEGSMSAWLSLTRPTSALSSSVAAALVLDRLGKAGVATAICHGIDNAVATLEDWQLLRGAVQ